MNKSSLVVAAVLILAALDPRSAASQVTLAPGLKGGLSISAFGEPWSTLKKPALGAFLSINLNKIISVQPEVYWLTQGGSVWGNIYYDEMGNLIEPEYRWSLSYIHLPVLAKLYPISKGTFRPVLFAGPAFDLLLRAVEVPYDHIYTSGGDEEDIYRGDDANIKDVLKGINWDIVAGAGIEVALTKVTLVVEARYTLGLTNIDRRSPDSRLKTSALMFLAGVGF
jgi:hypothetical protein